jgi:shikimate 5-dehydrogenase
MSGPRPSLIVSLPARDVEAARRELEEARVAGADLAEVRIDRWDPRERSRLGELFPSPLPLLATYRSRAEGGEGSDDPEERRSVLSELARHPFRLVDLEMARDPRALAPVGPGPGTVLSRHFPSGTGPEELERTLLTDPAGSEFVKVVLPSTVGEAIGPLRACLPDRGASRIVLHTTGASGPLYRAWAWSLGFSAVYASLPDAPGRSPVEPSQIPVDHMRFFLDGSAPGPLLALVGHPVAHTRSPGLFYRWMRARGDRGLYIALDIASEAELADVVPALSDSGFRGVNVTRPWKQAALELASRIGPGAGPCGCANVLTFAPGGGIEAENTDLAALIRRFRELLGASEWDGERLTVAGSGGAARAALAAAQAVGAEATVVARDVASGRRVAGDFGARMLRAPPPTVPELLVNTTPVGRTEAGAPGFDFAPWIPQGGRVLDLVYAPDDALLRRTAEARGARYEDGWRLLVYQAAESYGLWWGAPPTEAEILGALRGGP